jgi:hypothetical protein
MRRACNSPEFLEKRCHTGMVITLGKRERSPSLLVRGIEISASGHQQFRIPQLTTG